MATKSLHDVAGTPSATARTRSTPINKKQYQGLVEDAEKRGPSGTSTGT